MRNGESKTDLLQGSLDLLILKSLSIEAMNGWQIARRIGRISNEWLELKQGSLYPCLHRLEAKGWIEASWGVSENNRRAKFYDLKRSGRQQLESEIATWKRYSAVVEALLAMGTA